MRKARLCPGAEITATNVDTSAARTTVSSSSGDFNFQDLPLGTYSISISHAGFSTTKVDKVSVSAGETYTLPVKLSISSSGTTVEVEAAGVALDTTSMVQTTDIPSEVVNEAPSNGRDFTQLLQYSPGFAGYSLGGGAGAAQVNGVRTNQVNWQIEGTDNNDLWWNIPAVNQGGGLRNRGYCAAFGRDRAVFLHHHRHARDWTQRRRHGQPLDQIGHQQRAWQRLLLQPQ